MTFYIIIECMASDRDNSLYEKVHSRLHKHLHKHIAKHINAVHRHLYRLNRFHEHANHIFVHLWELIIVWAFAFFSLIHAWNSWSLPNNTSFWYPLQKVSTLECRTQYREDMDESCKINLPIIKWANYAKYMSNTTYRSIYTTLRAAPYSDTWNQEIWAHAWIDIATARGTPLYSIWNGVVYSAWRNSSYGNLVRIKYIYNWEIVYWVYAHMDTIEVEAWQVVTRWQRIWTVWNTWNTSWALWWYHVHFEIDKDNGWRPAYSYTNCADLDKWHYKIIQNGLCRNELFKYQYDPIKILEWIPKSEADKPTIYSSVKEEEKEENIQTNTWNQNNVVVNTWIVASTDTWHSSAQNTGKKVENQVNTWNTEPANNTSSNTWNNSSNNTSNTGNNKPQETVKPTEETKPIESVNISTWTNEQSTTPVQNNPEPQPVQQQVEQTKPTETTTPTQNTEQKPQQKDPEVVELNFSKLTWMPQHFMTQRDIEMKSKLNTRSLKLWETLTLDIEVFKKWTSENREYYSNWILQTTFDFLTNNDNISINITSLQLLTKWKATVEITGNKSWKSAWVINLWWQKIWVLNINVQ